MSKHRKCVAYLSSHFIYQLTQKMAANIGVVKHVLPQKASSRFAMNTSCTKAQKWEFGGVLFGFSDPSPQLLATLTGVCGS